MLDVIESHIGTFFGDGMGLVTIDLHNFNLDDDNYDGYDHKAIAFFRRIAWCSRFKQSKACKRR